MSEGCPHDNFHTRVHVNKERDLNTGELSWTAAISITCTDCNSLMRFDTSAPPKIGNHNTLAILSMIPPEDTSGTTPDPNLLDQSWGGK